MRQFDGATLVIGSECFELFDQTWDVVQWVDEQRDRVHDIEGVSLNLWVVFQLIQRHRGEWFEFELIIRMSFEESLQFQFEKKHEKWIEITLMCRNWIKIKKKIKKKW